MINIDYCICPKCKSYVEHAIEFITYPCGMDIMDIDYLEEKTCGNCGYVYVDERRERINKM